MPYYAERPSAPPQMQAVIDRWLAAHRLINRSSTVSKLDLTLRCLVAWLTQTEPAITHFADLTREHLLAYLTALAEQPNEHTGRPLSAVYDCLAR